MNGSSRVIVLISMIALVCSGLLMSAGCEPTGEDPIESPQGVIEIRFQVAHDDVARILIDIIDADSGLPFFTNLALTKLGPDVWRGDVPPLPRNQQFRFIARALNAGGVVTFSGEALATLTVDNQSLQIALTPAQNNPTFPMPRIFRIVYPTEMFSGQEEQVAFTILGNAGAAIGIQITAIGSPMTPAAEFSPATGTVTLTNTVADFMTVYTPPEVTVDTDFDYQVTIKPVNAHSAGSIITNFRTHIKPRPSHASLVIGTRPSVLFGPVIRGLAINGSKTPGTVELFADVSDDSAPAQLAFQWSYTPSRGTAAVTFANNGQGNPGWLEGYTVSHQGTITLAVTDENSGTTTLHYQLLPGQFADAVDHGSSGAMKASRPAAPKLACLRARAGCAPDEKRPAGG